VDAVGSPKALCGAELVVACDVTTAFTDAAKIFGPQKGATPEQVEHLTERLKEVAAHYRRQFDVDVDTIEGAGAAGGLSGGLAALGGTLVPGFGLVADLVDLQARLARADLVVTGEGHLDAPSLEGKVVGGVIAMAGPRVPVLCVVGDADPAVASGLARGVEVVRLVEVAGPQRARSETLALVEQVVGDWLPRAVQGDLAPPAPHAP
jgi:glycerate kinase